MAKKKLRPLGDTLLDLEAILDEMVDSHELQWGDILGLVKQHLEVHNPDAQEKYVAGGVPVFYYGPPSDRIYTLNELERQSIERTLIQNNYDVTRSAASLGIGRFTLYRKMQQYQIQGKPK